MVRQGVLVFEHNTAAWRSRRRLLELDPEDLLLRRVGAVEKSFDDHSACLSKLLAGAGDLHVQSIAQLSHTGMTVAFLCLADKRRQIRTTRRTRLTVTTVAGTSAAVGIARLEDSRRREVPRRVAVRAQSARVRQEYGRNHGGFRLWF